MKKFSILFISILLITACQDEEVQPNNPSTGPSGYHVSYTLDGTSFVYENGVDQFQLSYSNSKSVNAPDDQVTISPGSGMYNFSTNESVTISINNSGFALSSYSTSAGAASALESVFTTGNHDYKEISGNTSGVNITFYDGNVSWESEKQGQPISTAFSITESVESTNSLGEAERKVKGTFNCTLFNDSGASKVVTNGIFNLLYSAP